MTKKRGVDDTLADESLPSAAPRRDPVIVVVHEGAERSRHTVVETLQIGRSPRCDIVIPLAGLSRHHAQVYLDDDGGVAVEDLGSQNGTWLNNARIDGATRLRHGDLLNFYDYGLLFLEDPDANFEVRRLGDRAGQMPDEVVGASTTSAARHTHHDEIGGFTSLGLGDGAVPEAHYLESTGSRDEPDPSQITDWPDVDAPVTSATGALLAGSAVDGDLGVLAHGTAIHDGSSVPHGWPSAETLVLALRRVEEPAPLALEILVAGRLVSRFVMVVPMVRVGSDARCEVALPQSAGLEAWHLTLARFGGWVVCSRMTSTATLSQANEEVSIAVVTQGHELRAGNATLRFSAAGTI